MNASARMNSIAQVVLKKFKDRRKFVTDLDARIDETALETLLQYFLGNVNWEELVSNVSGLAAAEQEPPLSESTHISVLIRELTSLSRFPVVGTVFEELAETNPGIPELGHFSVEPPSPGLGMLSQSQLGIFAEVLLEHSFPGLKSVLRWHGNVIRHRGLVVGYVLWSGENLPTGDEVAGPPLFAPFSIYQDFSLEDASGCFIRKLRTERLIGIDSPILIFLYSAQHHAFYLSGLEEMTTHAIRWDRTALEGVRDDLAERLSLSPNHSFPKTAIAVTKDYSVGRALSIEGLVGHFAGQIVKAWEYFFYRQIREAIFQGSVYESVSFVDLLAEHVHLVLPYLSLAVWKYREGAFETPNLYTYRKSTFGGEDSFEWSKLSIDNELGNHRHLRSLQEFWEKKNTAPEIVTISGHDLLRDYGDIKGHDLLIKSLSGVDVPILRIPLRPGHEENKNVEAAVLEFMFDVRGNWFPFADEICQFVSQAFVAARHFRDQFQLAADAKRGRLARNVRHEMGYLIERINGFAKKIDETQLGSAEQARQIRNLKSGLHLAELRLDQMTSSDVRHRSFLGKANLLHFIQFIDDLEDPESVEVHGYEVRSKLMVWPAEASNSFTTWGSCLSESALYTLWNNFRRNAIDVLRLYSWPSGQSCTDKLLPRLTEIHEKLGTYADRFKNSHPLPKLFMLLAWDAERNRKVLWFLDNAPELAGRAGVVNYSGEETRWNHVGYDLIGELVSEMQAQGKPFKLKRAAGLDSEGRALLLKATASEEGLEEAFDFSDESLWTLAGIEILEE